MQTDFTKAPEVIEANSLAERTETAVGSFTITTAAQYEDSATMLRKIKAGQNRLEELRTAITGPLNASLRAVNALFKAPAERLEKAERSIKGEITRYQNEQERIRQEEQRKADAEARRLREAAEAKARQEREEAERKAKAEREAAEAKRREQEAAEAEARRQREAQERAEREAAEARRRGDEEAARKAAAEAATATAARRAEEERAAAAAKAALRSETKADNIEARGEEKAQELELQAASTVAPIIHREPPRVQGVATREVWKFEITDPSKINPAFLMPDEKKIGAQVRALKGDAAALIGAGVRVWPERQIAAGAA